MCVVEAGGRVLTASCVRPAEDNMVVSTNSPKVQNARRTLVGRPTGARHASRHRQAVISAGFSTSSIT